MPAHLDIPTRDQVEDLIRSERVGSVSIYLPTRPDGTRSDAERIELGNMADQGVQTLEEQGVPKATVRGVEESLADLVDDDEFWRFQANTLSLFADISGLRSFRLPNQLESRVEVSDRFFVKPLLRSLTFPHAAFVLALAQGSVRLVEASPDLPAFEVRVPDLPRNVAKAVGKSSIKDRSPSRRIQGSEGQKLRMRQYSRQIEQAIRPFLSGMEIPLVLAGVEPLLSVYRSVNTYPHLAEEVIEGNPEDRSSSDLASSVRPILDAIYAEQIADIQQIVTGHASEGRGVTDLADVARAAAIGAVDTLMVDIETNLAGSIDRHIGGLTLDESSPHSVTDEIARMVLLTGGRVYAVRGDEVPGSGPVAAFLRFPLT